VAAYCGHKEIVDILIKRGAEVNVKNKNGQTPLNNATRIGHKEIMELLIENGACQDIISL
jgi:ankyrin repeat protein